MSKLEKYQLIKAHDFGAISWYILSGSLLLKQSGLKVTKVKRDELSWAKQWIIRNLKRGNFLLEDLHQIDDCDIWNIEGVSQLFYHK